MLDKSFESAWGTDLTRNAGVSRLRCVVWLLCRWSGQVFEGLVVVAGGDDTDLCRQGRIVGLPGSSAIAPPVDRNSTIHVGVGVCGSS